MRTFTQFLEQIQSRFQIDHLPNGFIRVFARDSKLTGLWNPDGTFLRGDLNPKFVPEVQQAVDNFIKPAPVEPATATFNKRHPPMNPYDRRLQPSLN